ncbi:MAG: sulfotransferase [Rickettsiales bacterium]|nr:sulfotransferase [Rickettsiales bacterium]
MALSSFHRLSRALSQRALFPLRRLTSGLRVLPSALILGCQRGGTTRLHHALHQHPQLYASYPKELHFFDGGLPGRQRPWRASLGWYKAHFPLSSSMVPGMRCLESSPLYLFHPEVPARVASVIPSARFIVLLRDPVERAISHFFHERAKGREALSLSEALAAEERRLKVALGAGDYNSRPFLQQSYRLRGEYATQLERWLQRFSREQFLFLRSEDLVARPEPTVMRILDFLEVAPMSLNLAVEPANAAARGEDVPWELRDQLQQHFREHNERLGRLLGEDFSAWS